MCAFPLREFLACPFVVRSGVGEFDEFEMSLAEPPSSIAIAPIPLAGLLPRESAQLSRYAEPLLTREKQLDRHS